ncbi:MAG: WecB/TagA/CpsF family glycosyltransferase [Bacteroidales bacterium]|jgi:N-acetylglucosaminyldiphosphoundecaprenol N-acetyl-beta-D-mannosaminyltransferase
MSKPFLLSNAKLFSQDLQTLPIHKLLINTLNAYCFKMAQIDKAYAEALNSSDILLPDGISVVIAKKLLTSTRIKKIAGADLFYYEMNRLNITGGSCFFLGSSESTLKRIIDRSGREFPKVKVQKYSPPFKPEFSPEDNAKMVELVNAFKPDVLFIGMTAPKQEKWAYAHFDILEAGHICCIGAVFDFYARNIKRAPRWLRDLWLEWFYRLIMEPRRMWRRYLLGNPKFIWLVIKEWFMRDKT